MAEETKAAKSEFGEHMRAAGEAFVSQWKSLIPKEFWEHGRAARREGLLALRSLVDAAIERIEETEGAPKRTSRRKVKVEVE